MGEKNVLVFVPDNLHKGSSGYLRGRKKLMKNCEVFYITNYIPLKKPYQSIGFIGQKTEYTALKEDISLFINGNNGQILVRSFKQTQPVTQIIYDYEKLKNSDIVFKQSEKYGEHFKILCKDIRKSFNTISGHGNECIAKLFLFVISIIDFFLKIIQKSYKVVQKSSTFIHFEESLRSMKFFLNFALEEKKITPMMGNILISKPVDIAIGIFLTGYIVQYEDEIYSFVHKSIECIISNLRGLLLYLMGSPIGLKLNYGFNNFLGQFFLYHIALWRIFLHGAYPILMSHFRYFVLPGILGLSFQIAMISDVIAIATFHSYCIYINAARLFNLQLTCLISLWRVLIGRKFNPLRNRVDSCQYSQNQLFIGTLAFTILLFLLPTTTMYYVVFSIFRLVILLIDRLLSMIRNIFYYAPLYSIFLWIIDSSLIAGNVNIEWKSFDDVGNVKIEAKLNRLPFITTIKKFAPDSVTTQKNQKTLGEIFHCSITGTIL